MTDNSQKVIPVSSPELYEAYKAWRDQDVEDGSSVAKLKRHMGLCLWVTGCEANRDLRKELELQFHSKGLNGRVPFEEGGSYSSRSWEGTQHLNSMRIQWVNDRIADYEKEHGL